MGTIPINPKDAIAKSAAAPDDKRRISFVINSIPTYFERKHHENEKYIEFKA